MSHERKLNVEVGEKRKRETHVGVVSQGDY